jgi:outer membrane protein
MKKLFKALLLTLQVAVFGISVSAQDTLSLEQAIRIGLENNYSIQIAENSSQISMNNHSMGNAGMLPSVTAYAARTKSVENTHMELISGLTREGDGAKSKNFSGNVSFGWTIFNGMGMFITYDKLGELRKLGETNLQLQVENTISDINIIYHQIVREQERLKVIKNILDLSAERMEIALTKYELGRVSRLEYLAAQVDYNADTSSYIVQLERLNDAKIDMNMVMGMARETDYHVQSRIYFLESLNRNQLYESMMISNSAKKRYLLETSIAHLEARELRAARFPVINLVSSYNHRQSVAEISNVTRSRAEGLSVGVNASIGIFNGYNLNRRIQNAKINIEISELALEELDLRLQSHLDKAFNNYRSNLILYELEQKNVAVARENSEIALERYRLGNTTAIELREAQLNLARAEHRLLDAAYSVKYSEIDLLQLAGNVGAQGE